MSYTLLDEKFPKARKEHQCIWCGEGILAGEKYCHEKSIYEGDFQDHKWHLECHKAAQIEIKESGEGSFDAYNNERPAKSPQEPQGEK